MTKTISTLLTGLFISVLLLVTSMSAHAASYWKLEVSTPATTLQSSTFNLDYSIMASDTNEDFTVQLIANNNVVETQNVTTGEKFGYNGRFTKTNVPEGSYTYFVKATSATDASEQQSTARNVTVNLPDTQVVAITTNDTTGDTNVTAVRTNTTANGTEVATAVTTGLTETSSTQASTDVQGTSNNNSRNFTIAGLLLLAFAGGAIWYGISNYLNKKDV
jgi:hypothetical protein